MNQENSHTIRGARYTKKVIASSFVIAKTWKHDKPFSRGMARHTDLDILVNIRAQ